MGEGGIDKGDSDWIGSDIELEGINSIERIQSVEVPMKSVLVSVGILGEGGVTNGWIRGKDESEARIEVGLSEVDKIGTWRLRKNDMEKYAHKKWHL